MLDERLHTFFTETCPTRPGDALLVAVSGGPDSMALLTALLEANDALGLRLEAAHLDHGLRGEEGREDARFVSAFCDRRGVTLHRRAVDLDAMLETEGGSVEALARRERYSFFEEAAGVAGARWIATGHTADDQVETFLMNLVRGAGPRGLGGMLPVGPGPLCRPLLGTWREEVLIYMDERNVEFRLDSTNDDLSLTRNLVRHRLVPFIDELFDGSVLRVLARGSQLMNEIDEHLSLEANRILREVRVESTDPREVRLEAQRLAPHHPALRRAVVRAALEDLAGGLESFGLTHIDQALALIARGTGSGETHLPRGILARREYDDLVLRFGTGAPAADRRPEPSPPLDPGHPGQVRWGRVQIDWRTLSVRDLEREQLTDPRVGLFDPERLVPPVYVRGVRSGDRLEPYGMSGRQKISDLLVNRKVPRHLRPWVPILCDNGGQHGGERVLWVVGHRRARHAPIDRTSDQVLCFQAETIV